VIVPAVTVKVAVVLEAATATEAGVVSRLLLSESVTVVLLVGAALKVTVQVLLALEASEVGLQAREVMVGVTTAAAVTVPAVPVIVMALPEASDAAGLVTVMEVLLTEEASVTFTTATTPLAIVVVFIPVTRQV